MRKKPLENRELPFVKNPPSSLVPLNAVFCLLFVVRSASSSFPPPGSWQAAPLRDDKCACMVFPFVQPSEVVGRYHLQYEMDCEPHNS